MSTPQIPQFKERDLNRLKNLLLGKFTETTLPQVVYHSDYKEKTDPHSLKAAVDSCRIPLFCPECKSVMNHKFDKEVYSLHGHCYTCQVKMETELKRTGKWEEWYKDLSVQELLEARNLIERYYEDLLTTDSAGIVTESGESQNWEISSETREVYLTQKENLLSQVDQALSQL